MRQAEYENICFDTEMNNLLSSDQSETIKFYFALFMLAAAMCF